MSWHEWLTRKQPKRKPWREPKRGRSSYRPEYEALEDRQLLAIFTVTNPTDDATGTVAGTLSSAIQTANKDAVVDTVQFNIGAGGVQTIAITGNFSGANAVSMPLVIDGNSQPTLSPTTGPLIDLNFNGGGTTKAGLTLGAGSNGSIIRGIAIRSASTDGLTVSSNGNQISNVYVGVQADGSTPAGNTGDGVEIKGSNNTFGGTGSTARNIVVNNTANGINIDGGIGNLIQNSYIGLLANGSTVSANTKAGILLQNSANNNSVGGTASGTGNVISGNSTSGVALTSGANANTIQGNLIGLDSSGLLGGKGNTGDGINVDGASSNGIFNNVISQNGSDGIEIQGSTTQTAVRGNIIGLDVNGATLQGNTAEGINIKGTSGFNIIGGTGGSATRNTISGNGGRGILVDTGTTGNNQIQGNYIGTDRNGAAQRSNTGDGIQLKVGSNTVGGVAANSGNVISGNQGNGINVLAGANTNLIQANIIGANASGTVALPNTLDGILLASKSNTVGGTSSTARNIIAGNIQNGINITGATSGGQLTLIQGNFIGVLIDGKTGLANSQNGVLLQAGATKNTIGGTASGAGNVIAFNTLNGVTVGMTATDTTTKGNTISGNSIFTNGLLGIDLGNDGVTANDTQDPDTGANGKMNFPVIASATTVGSSTTITGTLNSIANTNYSVEFFASDSQDTTGNGEGQVFLGSALVQTDAQGKANLSFSTAQNVQGKFLSATATYQANAAVLGQDPGDTSEFAKVFQFGTSVITSTTLVVTQVDAPDPVSVGSTLTYTMTVTSTGGNNTNIVLTDTLPANVTFVSATSSSGTTTRSGNTVTANLGNLAAGSSATVTLVVTSPPVSGTVTNSASVTSTENPNASATSQTTTQSTTVVAATPLAVLGSDEGVASVIQVFNASTRTELFTYSPFGAFTGGVRVATGDFNADGQDDVVTAAGPGGGPVVVVLDGKTGQPLTTGKLNLFFAYDPAYTGGVNVAAGDVDGDGSTDIITGTDQGAAPLVLVYSGATGQILSAFFAFDPAFAGGVRVGAADVNADGKDDVIVGAGPGGASIVRVFSGASLPNTLTELSAGLAYGSGFVGGVYVAGTGDANGDGKADVVVGPGTGGASVADIFSAATTTLTFVRESQPIGSVTAGMRVSAFADRNSDGKADVFAGQGPGRTNNPVVLDAASLSTLDTIFTSIPGGVFVAASRR